MRTQDALEAFKALAVAVAHDLDILGFPLFALESLQVRSWTYSKSQKVSWKYSDNVSTIPCSTLPTVFSTNLCSKLPTGIRSISKAGWTLQDFSQ